MQISNERSAEIEKRRRLKERERERERETNREENSGKQIVFVFRSEIFASFQSPPIGNYFFGNSDGKM